MNTLYRSCCQPEQGLKFINHRHGFSRPFYFDTIPSPNAFTYRPRTDVSETKDSLIFEFELPGSSLNDIKVQINDENVLTVTGDKKNYESGVNLRRKERHFGKFFRSFELPENIDSSKIEAKFTDGVLSVTIQKLKPSEPKEKEIEIK